MASSPAPLSATDLTRRIQARFGQDIAEASDALGEAVVRVSPERYHELIATLRDDDELAFDYLDFVSAVDWGAERGFDVIAQLWSTRYRHGLRVKVAAGAEDASVPTISDLYPGADWHERETWELFGVVFDGHPNLAKLLLPEEFEGFPLRKEFALLAREAKPWPGAKEPGE